MQLNQLTFSIKMKAVNIFFNHAWHVGKKLWEHRWTIMLCILMWFNLYYMHYEVYLSKNSYMRSDSFTPYFFMCYDVLVSIFIFEIITLGKRRWAFSLAYVFILFFVIANIIYSRFLNQYMPLYALGETENFHGTWWTSYLPKAFRLSDVAILGNTILYFIIIHKLPNKKSFRAPLHTLCAISLILLYNIYKASRHDQVSLRSIEQISNWKWSILCPSDIGYTIYNPNSTIFYYGILDGQIAFGFLNSSIEKKLSKSEQQEIELLVSDRYSKVTSLNDSCKIEGQPNIVMIVLESGISAAIAEKIDDKYVMPNINKLIRNNDNYYNPTVKSNKGSGQSSDAQVSYFTGLIPLHNEMSILHVLKDSVIALPQLLHNKGYYTCITIPNNEDFWHQKELSIKYGFHTTNALGNEENGYWCHDREIFNSIVIEQKRMARPFFHVVLTLSMHGGYSTGNEYLADEIDSFHFPADYSQEYRVYLERCNYTDNQIGKYIETLKKEGLYDHTIIIIVSDHEVSDEIKMPAEKVLYHSLPLLIANSGIASIKFFHGVCNQVDLFPTLLDMFNIDSRWRGVGHSLLRKNVSYELTDREKRISANILRGNYFQGKSK